MDKIKCPNCGEYLDEMKTYDTLYGEDTITECCIFGCPKCNKEFQVDLHYIYVNYSIEGETKMPTYSEIIEELFALIKDVANSGAMLDEEIDTFERLTNEYYILKNAEKSE